MAVLKNLTQENEMLKAQIAALKAANDKPLKFKVSEKGALSVYGLGRWPVTLYRGQWETLLGVKNDILDFITENETRLSVKD
jgi:hypothetical protein